MLRETNIYLLFLIHFLPFLFFSMNLEFLASCFSSWFIIHICFRNIIINSSHSSLFLLFFSSLCCRYESRILASHRGLLYTYALETLALFIINAFYTVVKTLVQVGTRNVAKQGLKTKEIRKTKKKKKKPQSKKR